MGRVRTPALTVRALLSTVSFRRSFFNDNRRLIGLARKEIPEREAGGANQEEKDKEDDVAFVDAEPRHHS